MQILKNSTNKLTLLMVSFLLSIAAFAQDKKVDIDINTKPDGPSAGSVNNFFSQPWVWIVGGALFIIILVGILKSNKR